MNGSEAGSEVEAGELLDLHSSSGRSRHWKRWILWVGLLSIAGMGLAKWKSNSTAVPVRYKTEMTRRGNLRVTVTATGNLEPTNQVQVGSELSGILKTVDVDFNDTVTVGQPLATLDTSKLNAQIDQAKAALESAKADVVSAHATVVETRAELTRLTGLQKISSGEAVSREDLDTGQAAYDRAVAGEAKAKAAVSQAQAALDADKTDLSKTVIRSPINGVVLNRLVDPGQTVAASLQAPELFLLAEDLSKMQLHVDVDEADVGLVNAGQDATFTVDAYPNRKFPARIHRVSYGSETTDGVVTYETVLDVDNRDLSLRPGMTATATITVKNIRNALLVPNAALRFSPPETSNAESTSGGSLISKILPHPPARPAKTRTETNGESNQSLVWRVENNQLASIPVTVGSTDGTMTEILKGELTPGTELVVDTVEGTQ